MKKALIILTDGFEETEAIVPIDLLRRAGIDVTVAGLGKREVCGSHNIKVIADAVLGVDVYDAVILPGGPGVSTLIDDENVLQTVKRHYDDGRLCAAICAAPKVFEKLGMLENRTWTSYFAGNEAAVLHGNVITAKAAGTSVEFSFEIIKYLLGKEAAQEVVDMIYYKL